LIPSSHPSFSPALLALSQAQGRESGVPVPQREVGPGQRPCAGARSLRPRAAGFDRTGARWRGEVGGRAEEDDGGSVVGGWEPGRRPTRARRKPMAGARVWRGDRRRGRASGGEAGGGVHVYMEGRLRGRVSRWEAGGEHGRPGGARGLRGRCSDRSREWGGSSFVQVPTVTFCFLCVMEDAVYRTCDA
jgi:hypothetical protein